MKKIKRVKIYVKNNNNAIHLMNILRNELLKCGFEISDVAYDLAISIGGDGTFLKMIHDNHFNSDIYYASINAGSLGFLSTFDDNGITRFVKSLQNNSFRINTLDYISTKIIMSDLKRELSSINEFTIRKTDFSSFRCSILIDNILLDKYIGDGLVISSPLGSTGYNMALNGVIVDNDIHGLLITPIAPISNKVYKSLMNSIVIGHKRNITIIPEDSSNLCFLTDGKLERINNINKIDLSLSLNKIQYIISDDYNYINNIRSKVLDSKE